MAHIAKLTDNSTGDPVFVNLDQVASISNSVEFRGTGTTLYMVANGGPTNFVVKENVGDIFGFNARS